MAEGTFGEKDMMHTWRKMKKLLKETFFPSYYIRENFSMLHHLEQGNKSVEEYAREFKVYAMKCGVNKDETQTLVRFSSQYLRVGLQK